MNAKTADAYDVEAASFVEAMDTFVTENFGRRCEEYEPGCACCDLWALRDQVRAKVIFEPTNENGPK